MNPVEFHPFEMQFEVPGTDGQTVYTRRFQAPRRLIILGCGYVAQSLCRFASQLTSMRRTTDPPLPILIR